MSADDDLREAMIQALMGAPVLNHGGSDRTHRQMAEQAVDTLLPVIARWSAEEPA